MGYRVSGNGNGTKAGNQTCDQQLANIKKTALHAVGQTDAQYPAHHVPVKPEMQKLLKTGRQLFVVRQQKTHCRKNKTAEGGGNGSAGNTKVKTVDQQCVSGYIAGVGNDGDGYGLSVFAHRPQNSAGRRSYGHERIAKQGDKKVGFGVGINIFFNAAVDQLQKRTVEAEQHNHQGGGNKGGGIQKLIGTGFGFFIIAAADILGGDYRTAYS